METNNLIVEIENAVDEAISSRNGLQRQAVGGTASILVLAVFLPYLAFVFDLVPIDDNGKDPFPVYLISSGAMLLLAAFFWKWQNKRFGDRFAESIMPILCKIAGGFSYKLDGHDAAE